jgi:copper chaperone CopZ
MKDLKFRIEGMHCTGCSNTVQQVLRSTPGVETALVDFQTGEARVRFDESRVGSDEIAEAVRTSGFGAEDIASGDEP